MFSIIKNKLKAFFLLLFGVLLLSAPFKASAADGPQFNFLPDDPKTIRGLNDSAGNIDNWRDPVSGISGDTFSGLIYYHNGFKDTVAKNTRVKIDLPIASTNNKVVVRSHIWADNAAEVTDTVTYSFPENVRVIFMPERTTWFPNFDNDSPSAPLLGGQTGVEVVGPNGLGIGDIRGCWDYLGYVRFQFRVEKLVPEVVDVKIEKSVRNASINATEFVKQNEALAGDTLEYKVTVRNSGTAGISNAIFRDLLPANTAYVADTARISVNGGPEVKLPNAIFGDGASLGNLPSGYDAVIKFCAKTSPTIAGNEVLVNTAYLMFNKETISSQAFTKIKKVIVPGQPGPGENLPVTGAETWILPILGITGGSILFKYRAKIALLKKMIA